MLATQAALRATQSALRAGTVHAARRAAFGTLVNKADFVIIGSGIVGASAAYELAGEGRVVLLEREGNHGYHSTGRSAALYSETYGTPLIRALTTASKRQYLQPEPALRADHAFLTPRGVHWVATAQQLPELEKLWSDLRKDGLVASLRRVSAQQTCDALPFLRREFLGDGGGIVEPDAMDIDVNGLHMAYLRAAKARKAHIHLSAEVHELGFDAASECWLVRTTSGAVFSAPVVVNAAGAWADVVADMAKVPRVALQPKRRTIIRFPIPKDSSFSPAQVARWPMVFDVSEQFYIKPDAGQLLASPSDATPVDPQDVATDELDVAICVDRVEQWTTLAVGRLTSSWAGLRSFVPDHDFVLGADALAPPGFVWACGQGGYGIQTAPAAARAIAAIASGKPLPSDIADLGVTKDALSPARLMNR